MPIGSLKDLYLAELEDLLDAEDQIVRALPRFAEAARAPELRDALRRHAEESRLHLERLQLVFTHWGERRIPRRCQAVAALVRAVDERVTEATTPDVRDAAVIASVQRVEHYEIAAYGCAHTYAHRLNRPDEARLLRETLEEERRIDARLTEIAESHVNDDARSERDLQTAPGRSELRYVAAADLPGRSGQAEVDVRNGAADDLGHLDGFLVDAAGRPRYIVVDPHGLFIRRRYLIPASHVRLDQRSRVFRIDLDKEVANRYPAFDPDAFEQMDESEWRGYEERILAFFPPARRVDEKEPGLSEDAPDWLLSGNWTTVPHERAERLPEEARAYVNEFDPASAEQEPSAPERERIVARRPDEEAGEGEGSKK